MMLSYAHRQCVLGGLQSQPQPQHRAFLAACSPANNPLPRQRRTIAAPLAAVASDPLSPPQDATAVPIFDKIAACVEANDSVHRFETIAGRAAMIGFSVACVAELLLPHGGLFSSVSSANLEQFSQVALAAVAASAGVAALSKPRIGSQLREAVHSSMTALKRSKSSLTSLDVDSAVDFIFESVFNREMLADMLDEHEWI